MKTDLGARRGEQEGKLRGDKAGLIYIDCDTCADVDGDINVISMESASATTLLSGVESTRTCLRV